MFLDVIIIAICISVNFTDIYSKIFVYFKTVPEYKALFRCKSTRYSDYLVKTLLQNKNFKILSYSHNP